MGLESTQPTPAALKA